MPLGTELRTITSTVVANYRRRQTLQAAWIRPKHQNREYGHSPSLARTCDPPGLPPISELETREPAFQFCAWHLSPGQILLSLGQSLSKNLALDCSARATTGDKEAGQIDAKASKSFFTQAVAFPQLVHFLGASSSRFIQAQFICKASHDPPIRPQR